MRSWLAAAAAMAALAAGRAEAAIEGPSPTGFTAVETAHIAASPDRVFTVLIQPARWWRSVHTFSGSAANLSLDLSAGCMFETLPDGGSGEFLRVVHVEPGQGLISGLRPLQPMPVQGALTFGLTPAGGGTDLKLTFAVAGLGDLAEAIDRVEGAAARAEGGC